MKRMVWLFSVIVALCIAGCNSAESDTDSTYKDMTSKYTLLTIAELWTALDDSNSDYNGTYILVKGVLHSVGTNSVILIDADTKKAVTCTFETSIDLTDLSDALANNSSTSDEDIVTVGGDCYYYTDTSSYPYLESCDYFYINKDA
ncbi:MAG: hypothetical protein ABSA71_05670 [Desulfomonilia bacterium]